MGSCCSKIRRKSRESDWLEGVLDYEKSGHEYVYENDWPDLAEPESRGSWVTPTHFLCNLIDNFTPTHLI